MFNKKYHRIWIFISIIFIFVSMYINYILLYEKENMGQYGDIFGASNALFTGIALVFLIYGILQQREEIKIAKEDLERTKDILEEQSKHMELQKFNDQFFSLINVLENFIVNYEYNNVKGNSAILIIKNNLFNEIRKVDPTISIFGFNKDDEEKVLGILNNTYNNISFRSKMESINQIIKLAFLISIFINTNKEKIDVEFYSDVLESCINESIKNILMLYLHKNEDGDAINIAKWP